MIKEIIIIFLVILFILNMPKSTVIGAAIITVPIIGIIAIIRYIRKDKQ